MIIGKLGRLVAGIVGVALLAMATPASAQLYSDGYKFLKAVADKDVEVLNQLLDAPGSTVINARDLSTGETGLHIIVHERRDVTWFNLLVQGGANPNIRDKKGVTPLVLASNLGNMVAVEALIRAGAQVDVANNAGETPLMLAIHSSNAALMRLLLEAGANVDRYDNSGRSARDYARANGGTILSALERYEKDNSKAASGPSYGPSF